MSDTDKPLLEQLREQHKEQLDAAAAAIEQRDGEREAFDKRSGELKADATTAVEVATRKAETDRDALSRDATVPDDDRTTREQAIGKEHRDAIKAADQPLADLRSAHRDAESKFAGEHQARMEAIRGIEQRIDEQELIERRREVAARASSHEVRIISEPMTYKKPIRGERAADQPSYFRDLAAVQMPSVASRFADSPQAKERLEAHAKEMDVELPKRQQTRERRADEQINNAEGEFTRGMGVQRRGFADSPFERRVNPNRADGQGGFFVPPLWLIDEYIPILRAGRVAAGLCRQMDLPPGTDSINIPKLSKGTVVAPQTADNAPVASQDIEDTSVQANVKTVAGQEDVAIQLIEQSPGQIVDQVIMEDLLADYNRLVDRQVLFAPGTETKNLAGGEIQGIYPSTNWSGTNSITWTESAPRSGGAFAQALGAMVSKIAYQRFDINNVSIVVHPRRWFWFATALDGAEGKSGRPLVVSDDFGPFNIMGKGLGDSTSAEGLAGKTKFGINVYIDPNIPITANTAGTATTGGASDFALAAKFDDLWLFEGDLRTRVLPEVLSGTLQIRYQVYNYLAFLVRYGQSISIASGTGFEAPAAALASSVLF